jgi:hypothetical protein
MCGSCEASVAALGEPPGSEVASSEGFNVSNKSVECYLKAPFMEAAFLGRRA